MKYKCNNLTNSNRKQAFWGNKRSENLDEIKCNKQKCFDTKVITLTKCCVYSLYSCCCNSKNLLKLVYIYQSYCKKEKDTCFSRHPVYLYVLCIIIMHIDFSSIELSLTLAMAFMYTALHVAWLIHFSYKLLYIMNLLIFLIVFCASAKRGIMFLSCLSVCVHASWLLNHC